MSTKALLKHITNVISSIL